ncbi:hypothetical protein P5673_005441, partial [Acropora cervicornis]
MRHNLNQPHGRLALDRTITMLRKLKENRSSSTALLEGMMILLFAVLAFVFFFCVYGSSLIRDLDNTHACFK